jgi:hypothetical protein
MSAPKFDLNMGKMKDPAFRASMIAQVNGMVKMATDKLMCDDACQFERKSAELKKKMDRAREVKKDIPDIYSEREKDYYVFTKGLPYYQEMMEQRYEATGKEILKKMLKDHKDQMEDLRDELQNYASGTLYEQNIRDLWKKYEREEKMYQLATLKMKNNISISDRQSSYEDVETAKMKGYRKTVFIIYYFIAFIILVYLIAKKRYTEIKIWIVFLFILIFPFIKTFMLKQGMSLQDRIKAYINNVYLDNDDDCSDCDPNNMNNPTIPMKYN